MRKFFLSIAALVLAALAVFFIYQINLQPAKPEGEVVLQNGARLVWQDCWFSAPEYVHCARLHTAPEQGKEQGGKKKSSFSLPVVVLRYRGFDRKTDPVLYMAGGPGSSAGLAENEISYWLGWFQKARLQRDLVLFDQRGAGLSEPRLGCPEYRQAVREGFIHNLSTEEKTQHTHAALKRCYQRMEKQGLPINELSTLYSAADVRDLMDALGYPAWNLQGVSYSTRLATVIEQKNPGKVRSMVLDSVYPVQKHFFQEWPTLLDASLKKIFVYCDSRDTCKKEHGNIKTKFWETVSELKENPLKIKVSDPSLGLSEVIFNDETFIDFLFDNQYESGSLNDLPAVIDAFYHRESDLLKDYILDFLQSRLQDSISEVVFRAIECIDNPPVDEKTMATIYDKYPKLKPYLFVDYDACKMWEKQIKNQGINKLTKKSEVPVLILSGEDDPVTPISWVDDVLNQYPHSEFFSFPNISHSVMDRMPCAIELYSQFLKDPSIRPTADCRKPLSRVSESSEPEEQADIPQ